MQSAIDRILALMGRDREPGGHRRLSEIDVANALGLAIGDVEIALGMMAEEGLLESVEDEEGGVIRLSERGEARRKNAEREGTY